MLFMHQFNSNPSLFKDTNNRLDKLQEKLTNFFQTRKESVSKKIATQSQQRASQSQQTDYDADHIIIHQPYRDKEESAPNKEKKSEGKSGHHFKLFHKQPAKLIYEEREEEKNNNKYNMPQISGPRKQIQNQTEIDQMMAEVEIIEKLIAKKLVLKEEQIFDLEKQIYLQKTEKIHLYKINQQLQKQLNQIQMKRKQQNGEESEGTKSLRRQYKRLTKTFNAKKAQNMQLKRQQQLLQSSLRTMHHSKKQLLKQEIQIRRPKSKSSHIMNSKSYQPQSNEEETYLRKLVDELDKLKKMVKSKMSKSKSRLR